MLTNDYCTAISIVLYDIQCSFHPIWEQCLQSSITQEDRILLYGSYMNGNLLGIHCNPTAWEHTATSCWNGVTTSCKQFLPINVESKMYPQVFKQNPEKASEAKRFISDPLLNLLHNLQVVFPSLFFLFSLLIYQPRMLHCRAQWRNKFACFFLLTRAPRSTLNTLTRCRMSPQWHHTHKCLLTINPVG